jgi:catechol 2,3-dioxygenase-like lactoylglutathione lyase family enzyme
MIRGLHHNAYRCRDSEETRRFYEDFLGLELAGAVTIGGGEARLPAGLHTFFAMGDGSYLAFFEVPERQFDFKRQDALDLHIALAVDDATLERMFARGQAEGREVRGIVDHGFCRSIYFRDPDGYVVELTADTGKPTEGMEPVAARRALAAWQAAKG